MLSLLYYNFVHQSPKQPPLTLQMHSEGEPWQDLRYRLEKKHCMHSGANKRRQHHYNKHQGCAYFVGWRTEGSILTMDNALKSEELCVPGDRILLARRPLEPGMLSFVPPSARCTSGGSARPQQV